MSTQIAEEAAKRIYRECNWTRSDVKYTDQMILIQSAIEKATKEANQRARAATEAGAVLQQRLRQQSDDTKRLLLRVRKFILPRCECAQDSDIAKKLVEAIDAATRNDQSSNWTDGKPHPDYGVPGEWR